MFCPNVIKTADCQFTMPLIASICKIPTDAELLWMIAVTARPTKIPKSGFCPSTRKDSEKIGASRYGSIEPDMKERPINRSAKPIRTSAPSFFLWLFANIVMNAPIPKRTGAKNSGFNTSPHSLIDTIQLVTVVPILAPMMMPVACRRLIIPAFTKPTTITVVAELLWMIAVTPAPTSTPSKRFEVRISSTRCKRLPANFCRPSAIDSIPYRNIPSPPMN